MLKVTGHFILAIFCLLLALVFSVCTVLSSTDACNYILDKVKGSLDGVVNIDVILKDGNILSGFSADNINVTVPHIITISADKFKIDYDLYYLLVNNCLKVKLLDSTNLNVKLLDLETSDSQEIIEETPESESNEPFKINFPVNIELDRLKLDNFAYLSDIVDVKVASFDANLSASGPGAFLKKGIADNVDVHLKYTESEDDTKTTQTTLKSEKTIEDITASNKKEALAFGANDGLIEKLPEVNLPLDVGLFNFKVTKAKYWQDNYDTGLVDFNVNAAFIDTKLNIQNLDAYHERGEVHVLGNMIFEDYYSMDFKVRGAGAKNDINLNSYESVLYGLKGAVDVKGNLTDLKGFFTLSNPASTKVFARINVLSDAFPVVLDFESKQITYPLFSEEILANLENLNINCEGSLKYGINSSLRSKFTGFGFNKFDVDYKGKVLFDKTILDNFEIDGIYKDSPLHAQVAGTVNYGDTLGFDGMLKANIKDPSFMHKAFTGPLSLDGQMKVLYEQLGDKINIIADIPNVNSQFSLYKQNGSLEIKNVKGSLKDKLNIEALDFWLGENSINASGFVGKDIHVEAKTNFVRLNELYPGLKGSFKSNLIVKGNKDYFVSELVGTSQRIVYNGIRAQNLNFDALYDSKKKINISAIATNIKLAQGLNPTKQCVLDVAGTVDAHKVVLNCEGRNGGLISYSGSFDTVDNVRSAYNGLIDEFYLRNKLTGNFGLEKPVNFAYDLNSAIGNISKIQINGDNGTIVIDETTIDNGDVYTKAKLGNFNLSALNSLLSDNVKFGGLVDIDSDIAYVDSIPYVKTNITSDKGILYTGGIVFAYDALNCSLNLDDTVANVKANINLINDSGKFDVDASVLDPLGKRNLGGYVKVSNFDLSQFTAAAKIFNSLEGRVNINTKLSGNVTEPLFYGNIDVEGQAEPSYYVGQVNNFKFNLEARGNRGLIDGVVRLNEGPINIGGNLDWSSGANGDITFNTSMLPIFLAGYGSAYANVDTTVRLSDVLDIRGNINIPKGLISVKSLDSSAINPSKDEILIETGGLSSLDKEPSTPLNTILDINFSIGDDLKVKAMGLTGYLKGAIDIKKKQDDKDINANGSIYINDGLISVFGRHFIVNKAFSNFNGNIVQPNLDVEVIVDPADIEDDVQAGIKVTGVATKPEITLFSKPALSQNEILSYILYGHSLDKNNANQEGANSALLLGLGLSSTTSIVNSVVGALGVQNLQFGSAGSGDDSQVQVQGYITRKLRISYGYGLFSAVSEFKLRYELARKLYAEFISSVEQAVDIVYSFEFN